MGAIGIDQEPAAAAVSNIVTAMLTVGAIHTEDHVIAAIKKVKKALEE